jgi:hypothetical protein
MAALEAAMAVPGSTAACFAERARASRATEEEAATEHAAICRVIVDNQTGALGVALGPKAKERTYLAMLNAEGVFSVMHGLQWWGEAPSGACKQRGHVVAFEGEVRPGTNIPNLWRFEEPDEQLFRLLTLPPVSLTDTARFYPASTIVPRLSQMPEEPAGHQCAGTSSRSRSNGRPCSWTTRTRAQPLAGSWT